MARRGAYMTLDGPDGSGKTTQAKRLAEETGSHFTIEPGGTGQQLRSLLLDPTFPLTPEAEVLLFSADRNLTQEFITKPKLAEGISVVSDRSYLSTLAYQCYGRGLPLEYGKAATKLALGDAKADLMIIIDVPPEIAGQRMRDAGKIAADDRFEGEKSDFHERLRHGFIELAQEIGSRAVVIDGSGSQDEVFEQIYALTGEMLTQGIEV